MKRLFELKLSWLTAGLIIAIGAATMNLTENNVSEAAADDVEELPKAEPARIADRLSIIMRGTIASDEERLQFQQGKITLSALAERYKADQRFAERLAHFWTETLKIEGPFNFDMVEDTTPQKVTLFSKINPVANVNSTALILRKPTSCGANEAPRFELYANGNARNKAFTDLHECACNSAIQVKPWWSPNEDVRVCPTVSQKCGSQLSNCMFVDSRFSSANVPANLDAITHKGHGLLDEVVKGLTLEPGMLIAKTIQEDRDYRTILTTTQTILPGPVEAFLLVKGNLLISQSAGRFADGKSLNASRAQQNSWRWVERGAGNAGILTTPQYQQVTNGYRAKANRAYESFLCRQFIVPAGVTDGNAEEEDLTRRQPCASCHVELEPLGNMFKRWPEVGTNFLYDRNRNASGHFDIQPGGIRQTGTDALGAAQAFIKDDRFAECAVQRAYEFLVGHAPTQYDKDHSFPVWTKNLKANNYKLWPVMQDILSSTHFQGGWK